MSKVVRTVWPKARLCWRIGTTAPKLYGAYIFVSNQAWASLLLWLLHVRAVLQGIVAAVVACVLAAPWAVGILRALEDLVGLEDNSGTWLDELGLRRRVPKAG